MDKKFNIGVQNMEKFQIKFQKTGNNVNPEAPQYSLSYKAKDDIKAGYEILSLLKGDESFVLEVSSSLILSPKINPQQYVEDFVKQVREMGLDYKIRQNTVQSRSFFSQFFGTNKTATQTTIFVYVSDQIWKDGLFEKILPLHGARYYITNNDTDGKEILEKLDQMLESEKRQYFKMIVYHAAILHQFGISSELLNEENIKGLLKLK